jgi:hypothetical protein
MLEMGFRSLVSVLLELPLFQNACAVLSRSALSKSASASPPLSSRNPHPADIHTLCNAENLKLDLSVPDFLIFFYRPLMLLLSPCRAVQTRQRKSRRTPRVDDSMDRPEEHIEIAVE